MGEARNCPTKSFFDVVDSELSPFKTNICIKTLKNGWFGEYLGKNTRLEKAADKCCTFQLRKWFHLTLLFHINFPFSI